MSRSACPVICTMCYVVRTLLGGDTCPIVRVMLGAVRARMLLVRHHSSIPEIPFSKKRVRSFVNLPYLIFYFFKKI